MKPILFNTEMVRAILGWRKTVTRRVLKPQPKLENGFWKIGGAGWCESISNLRPVYGHSLYNRMPYQIGDILYVREAWNKGYFENSDSEYSNECWFEEASVQDGDYLKALTTYVYRADFKRQDEINLGMKWHPSIHMPKEAARIFLKVTGVRVEQLQDITIDQIVREGIYIDNTPPGYVPSILTAYTFDRNTYCSSPNLLFRKLWNSTIKKSDLDKYGWVANPWVWVIEFDRI